MPNYHLHIKDCVIKSIEHGEDLSWVAYALDNDLWLILYKNTIARDRIAAVKMRSLTFNHMNAWTDIIKRKSDKDYV